MLSLKHWKARLRARIVQPVDNRLWTFWTGNPEVHCVYRRSDVGEIPRYYPDMQLDALRATAPMIYNHVVHRFTAYVYDFDYPLTVDPRMGWLIPKAFQMLEQSFPMVNDPWDAVKPRPSTIGYLTHKAVTTLDRAVSVRYLWSNYYHFFLDTLPQFHLLDALGVPREVPVVIPEYVSRIRFVQDFRELSDFLSGREFVVQRRGDYVKVLRHTYVAKDTCHPQAIFDVLDTLKPHLDDRGNGKIYVRRDSRLPRALQNDAEIAGIAERHGFRVVDTAAISLREQITLFASARLVAGVHGAGLTNIIFRNRRPLTLLELFPANLAPEFYKNLCIQFGYDYERLLGGPLDARNSFYLDPIAFETALRGCSDSRVAS